MCKIILQQATIHQLLPSFVSGAITSKFGYSLTFLTEQGIRSLYLANTYYILSLWAQNTYETICITIKIAYHNVWILS